MLVEFVEISPGFVKTVFYLIALCKSVKYISCKLNIKDKEVLEIKSW